MTALQSETRAATGRRLTGAPRTALPRLALPELVEEPRRVTGGRAARELRVVIGAPAAGIAAGLVIGPVLGFFSLGWVPAFSYLWFLLSLVGLSALEEDGPTVRDRITSALMWSAGVAVVGLLALVVLYTLWEGRKVLATVDLSSLRNNFFTADMSLAGPLAPISQGGISFAIIGTLEQIAIALIVTVPLGIATAVFLNEVGGRFARLVRTVVEAMTALPSVVAGLFIYAAVIVVVFGGKYNGFSAALAISVLMLPIMIRSADVVLRLVPGNLREAGLALGAGQWSVVRRIVLPTVRSGLTTAIILGTAHGIGETAPALLTAGVTTTSNLNPFKNPQTPLPLAALEFIKNPSPAVQARGFATATTLLVLVLILFVTARVIGGQQAGQVSDGQRRRLAARSVRRLPGVEANHDRIRAEILRRSGTAGASPLRRSVARPGAARTYLPTRSEQAAPTDAVGLPGTPPPSPDPAQGDPA